VSALASFEFAARTRLVFGWGVLARLGSLARELGGRRVLLVTDAGLVASGHAARAEAALREAGLAVETDAAVEEDPDALAVARCAAFARTSFDGQGPELLVAVGGGSALDTAKGVAMLLASGGRMQDYWGYGKTRAPLLPLVAVPTTAGTGSEVQSYALVADEHTGQKMACGAAEAAPRLALLDPELTLALPRAVTAASGLDALGHALETAVTQKCTPLSDLFARAAFGLLVGAFERVLAEPGARAARADMLLGACWAGLAIEHSMLGAAHALANPLSARLGLAHGVAVGLALPAVLRFNAAEPGTRARYAELWRAARPAAGALGAAEALEELLAFLERALAASGLERALSAHGLTRARVPELAAEASRQWTAQFNPRALGTADFEALLLAAL
jgi:alcohol dehydrogenase